MDILHFSGSLNVPKQNLTRLEWLWNAADGNSMEAAVEVLAL